jgi:hypothetical protein
MAFRQSISPAALGGVVLSHTRGGCQIFEGGRQAAN